MAVEVATAAALRQVGAVGGDDTAAEVLRRPSSDLAAEIVRDWRMAVAARRGA